MTVHEGESRGPDSSTAGPFRFRIVLPLCLKYPGGDRAAGGGRAPIFPGSVGGRPVRTYPSLDTEGDI